jgi:hypothetical protein
MVSNSEPYPALRVLPAAWEEMLSRVGEHIEIAAGDNVAGRDDGRAIAFIRAGLARVFVRTTPGRQATIGYGKPGDVISLPASEGTRPYEVAAVWHTTVSLLFGDYVRSHSALDTEVLLQVEERLASWAHDAAVKVGCRYSSPRVGADRVAPSCACCSCAGRSSGRSGQPPAPRRLCRHRARGGRSPTRSAP